MKAIIEIPKHSNYKYEIKNNVLLIDRVLNQTCPHNYGYVPNTLCEDGDALDIFIISQNAIHPGAEVFFTMLGMLECKDGGKADNKIIAVLKGEEHLHDFDAAKWEIRNYLTTYKPGFVLESYLNEQEAIKSLENYKL